MQGFCAKACKTLAPSLEEPQTKCTCGILRNLLVGTALQPLEIHKVFLRVCVAHMPQNTAFQVQSSFAKGYSG